LTFLQHRTAPARGGAKSQAWAFLTAFGDAQEPQRE